MAKAKQQELSSEEKLEQALVPKEEHPYEVPSNWVWTRFSVYLDYEQPTDYIVESTEYRDDFNTPVLTAGKSFILGYTDENFGVYRNLPVIIFDDFTTDTKFVDFPFKVKSSAMKILHTTTDIDLKLIHYYMQTVDCDHSEHRRFWISTYSQLPFPLPPLSEQQRIVDRIESFFEKLDNAKELVQNALDTFEIRKAAILHKAFTGELTTKWREKNGVEMDSWRKNTFADITTKITDGFHNSPKPVDKGVPYVMARHVKPDNINYFNGLFMDEKNHKELFKKAFPKKGDILLVNIGAGTGTPAVVDVEFEFSFKNCAIIKLKENYNSRYVFYYLLSIQSRVLAEVTRGGAQPFLSLKLINKMEIYTASQPEQQEIVRILDNFLKNEQKAEELCDVIDKIDLMKKTILARAFRGELGTNDPEDESAVELLKDVLS